MLPAIQPWAVILALLPDHDLMRLVRTAVGNLELVAWLLADSSTSGRPVQVPASGSSRSGDQPARPGRPVLGCRSWHLSAVTMSCPSARATAGGLQLAAGALGHCGPASRQASCSRCGFNSGFRGPSFPAPRWMSPAELRPSACPSRAWRRRRCGPGGPALGTRRAAPKCSCCAPR